MATKRILVFGRAVWDEWRDAPEAPEDSHFGGPGANIAVHLAALGLDVALVTAFGSDANSESYTRHLGRRGVDVSCSTIRPGPLASVSIWLERPGFFLHGENDGFDDLETIDVVAAKRPGDPMVFVDFPLKTVSPFENGAVMYASPHITLIMGRTTVEDLRRLPWRAVFLNRGEADFIGGDERIQALSAERPGLWLVTQGPAPTLCFEKGLRRVFPVPPARCINPIGGGDAFAAGVIAGLEMGKGVAAGIDLGHAAARIIIGEVGCQSDRLTWDRLGPGWWSA